MQMPDHSRKPRNTGVGPRNFPEIDGPPASISGKAKARTALAGLLAVLILLPPGPARTATRPPSGRAAYISRLIIVGNKRFSAQTIRRLMASRPTPSWRWFSPPTRYDRLSMLEDVVRIRRYYRLRGFFQAKVSPRVTRRGDRVTLTITIAEGRPTMVRRVRIMFYGLFPAAWVATVKKLSRLKAGQRLDLTAYRRGKQAIALFLANRGYAQSQVLGRVVVSLTQRTAWITLRVTPGPRFRFGPVTMDRDRLNPTTLRRALTFAPGQVFSVDKMKASRLRLLNLRLFKSVALHPDWPRAKAYRVPIRVSLTRSPPNRLRAGLGFMTDEGLRASLGYVRRDPFGLGGRFEVVGRYSFRRRGMEAHWVKPYVFDRLTDFRTSAGFERREEVSFTDEIWWLDWTVFGRRPKNWSWLVRLRLARHYPSQIFVGNANAIGSTGAVRYYRENFLTLGLAYDSTDNPLYPTTGARFGLGLDVATGLLGSEVRYVKPGIYYFRYWPLGRNLTLTGRVRAVTIAPTEGMNDVYIFNRLFLGGGWSVRGYHYQKLGPLDVEGRPVGGRTSLELGLELMFPLYKRLKGVVFAEAGQVNPEAFQLSEPRPFDRIGRVTTDSLGFRYTVGFGIRYNTPVGPLRLDIGFKLNRPEALSDDYAIHFSIGQTF
jgi:outer membrane protein assembly complex protein YaeT